MINERAQKLVELIKENPTLPVVPMVDNEICGDECTYYQGNLVYCKVGKFCDYDDMIYIDDEESVRDDIGNNIASDFEELSDEEFEIEVDKIFNGIEWKEAIILYIDAP